MRGILIKEPKQYREDFDWMIEHSSELHRKYENKWVAIYKGKVIVASVYPKKVEKIAKDITGKKT